MISKYLLLVKPELFYLVRERLSFSTLHFSVQFWYTFLVSVILKLPVASRTMGKLFQEANSISLLQIKKHNMNKLQ